MGASRSRALASKAARMLRPPIVVHDLGSGTGSMMRWLAPLLPGPQTWVLHDWNHALLDHAVERARDATGHDAAVRTSVKDVAQLRDDDLAGPRSSRCRRCSMCSPARRSQAIVARVRRRPERPRCSR